MDMFEATTKVLVYTKGYSYEDFISDDKTIDAVIRNFGVIGEAANRITKDFKLTSPEIDWVKPRGFRNRIVHEYFGIDNQIVWQIVEDDMRDLSKILKTYIDHSNLTN